MRGKSNGYGDVPEWVVLELNRISLESEGAVNMAKDAKNEIGVHERECKIRYEAISDKLDSIPDLFTALSKTNRTVNIGVGIMLAIPACFGVITVVLRLTGKG